MKTTRKLLSILLTILMVCCIVPFAFADDSGGCGSGLTWTYNDTSKTLTITGNGAMNDYTKSGGGVTPLKTDAPWFSHSTEITRIVFGNGITRIGKNAFRKLTALTKIELPSSLATIEDYAFSECTSLVSATFGTNLKSIGAYAFNKCTALKTFNIPDSVESIADYAFYKCPVQNLELGKSLTTIGSYTFSECKLVNVTMYNKVEVIGANAFAKQNGKTNDKISHVYYYGSEADWNSISIGNSNEPLTGAQWHYLGAPVEPVTEPTEPTQPTNPTQSTQPTTQPDNGNDQPQQPSFFQRLIQWFRDLFARLFGR